MGTFNAPQTPLLCGSQGIRGLRRDRHSFEWRFADSAQGMAVDYATGVASQNNVAGAPAQFISGTPQVNLNTGSPSAAGNPTVTVSLQRTGLPLFFARICGSSIASVSATAIAEAYNPAYSQTNTAGTIPPAPKCVKPFLAPNGDQNQDGTPFADTITGQSRRRLYRSSARQSR